jgi:hypothetical protein
MLQKTKIASNLASLRLPRGPRNPFKPISNKASKPRYSFMEVDPHLPSKCPIPPPQRARASYLEVEEKGAPDVDPPKRKKKHGDYINAARSSRDSSIAATHVAIARTQTEHTSRMRSLKSKHVTVSWPIGQLKGKLKNELVCFLHNNLVF